MVAQTVASNRKKLFPILSFTHFSLANDLALRGKEAKKCYLQHLLKLCIQAADVVLREHVKQTTGMFDIRPILHRMSR